jgi:hypothetical protein
MTNLRKQLAKAQHKDQNEASVNKICDMIDTVEIENRDGTLTGKEDVPVRDDPDSLTPLDPLQRDENTIPNRGVKRRSNTAHNDTPKSTLDKCMRSKSPLQQMETAATALKPKLDENFKVPNSFSHSPTSHSRLRLESSPSSREYYTATSVNCSEKLSLPNYGLQRPEVSFTSPTSSVRSKMRMSPQEGHLKRTASQLSTGSEFHEEILPLRIKKTHRKISFESVKLNKKSTRTVTIQNASNKKLSLRVKIQGAGFTVSPREDFRMTSNEARSFEVAFSPSVVGAARGELTFELMTNSRCSVSIPLFAYGGHVSMRFEGLQKGPIGPAFITMGQTSDLIMGMTQTLVLSNRGTVPGFASLAFEKTKWSDFSMSESLNITPTKIHLMPGESTNVKIRFKATREEIRKILSLGKETTIIGEICIVSGDEPTRMRLLKQKSIVPQKFLDALPGKGPYDDYIRQELVNFVESWDNLQLENIVEKQIRTDEIALTVNRNLDETQIIAADFSMTEDSTSFMTFCEGNTIVEQDEGDDDTMRDDE